MMTKQEVETVTVAARGQILERVTFQDGVEAELYKRGVRCWAQEKGVIVRIWSARADSWTRRGFARAG